MSGHDAVQNGTEESDGRRDSSSVGIGGDGNNIGTVSGRYANLEEEQHADGTPEPELEGKSRTICSVLPRYNCGIRRAPH